jgi:hypothetical protein
MRNMKVWLSGVVCGVILSAAVMLGTSTSQAQPRGPDRSHWRYHDGRWDYWDQDDRRWYHTDGQHWYHHHEKDGWQPYRFDSKYGRDGFQRDTYRIPGTDAKIVIPRHNVYRPR